MLWPKWPDVEEMIYSYNVHLTHLHQSVALYADVNGRQFPVTRGQDVGKYQVANGSGFVSLMH